MPTYTLKDIKTQEEHDVNCSYDELQEILDAQPDLIKVLSTPGFVSSTKTHANSKTKFTRLTRRSQSYKIHCKARL